MSKRLMLGFIVLIVLCVSLASAKTTSLVIPVCKDLAHADPAHVCFETCVSTLGSDPRSNTSTAPRLAQIALEMTISKAKDIAMTIDKLLKFASPGVPVKQTALKDCLHVYSRVRGDLKPGLVALKVGDLDTASAKVSKAMNAAATCGHENINEGNNKGCPLTQKIIDFHNLSAISLGFTKLLKIIN